MGKFPHGMGAFFMTPTIAPLLPGPNIFAHVNPAIIPGAAPPCPRKWGRRGPRRGLSQFGVPFALDYSQFMPPDITGATQPVNIGGQLIDPTAGMINVRQQGGSPTPTYNATLESAPDLAAFNQALTNAQGAGLSLTPDQLGQISQAISSASPSQLASLTQQLNAAAAAPAGSSTGIMATINTWLSGTTTLPVLGATKNSSLLIGGAVVVGGFALLSSLGGGKRRR